MPTLKHYETTLAAADDGRPYLPVPFDPGSVWGGAQHLGGALNTRHFRGRVEKLKGGWGIVLTPMWLRDCGLKAGDAVSVVLTAEGPIGMALAQDVAASFATEPSAAAFWDGLAPFYRKAFVKWIDSTKGKPDVRAARIAEVTGLLKAGVKARPKV